MERVRTNKSLSSEEKTLLVKEKRQTMVKPLIHAIDRLRDITNQTPETHHEQWFHEAFSTQIENGYKRLTSPKKDEDLQYDWQPFKRVRALCYFVHGTWSAL